LEAQPSQLLRARVRILIISQYFHPENFGINEVAYDLAGRHSVTVLTGMPNYPSGRIHTGYGGLRVRRESVCGVSVIRVPIIPRGRSTFFLLALNYLSFAIAASILAPFIVREPMDVIFVYQVSPLTVGLPALVLRFLRKIPVVFWVQDIWPETLIAVNSLKSAAVLRAIRWLAVLIYRRCRMILVQSPAYISQIRMLGLSDADIRYFPNAAPNYYRPVTPTQDAPERQFLGKGFNIVFAGNIGQLQDFGTILSAAELLKDAHEIHWVIAGDGSLRRWVADEIAKRDLQDTCRLLGALPSERMPVLFALADTLLITLSPSRISGLTIPSKLQSYLACGRPIIGAVGEETSKIIKASGAGLVCAPGDPAALARAVRELYTMSPAARADMGMAGRTFFEQEFERSSLVEKLIAWLIEAAASLKPPPRTLPLHERIPAE
jgi:glycosyltransferase involved in cell wall biosynthesis